MNKPNLGLEPIIFFRNGGNNMNKFWDLLKESVIGQLTIVVMVIGLIAYLLVTGQEVPDQLWQAFMLILGFFFGSKLQQKLGR